MMAPMTGRLVLVGTPIGDFSDASGRLRKVLGEVDVVAAEDTRRLKRLTSELGIVVSGRVTSFFEGNERQRLVLFHLRTRMPHRVEAAP